MTQKWVKPSRWYYGLAGLVLAIGLVLYAILVANLMGSLERVVVPGQHELNLSEPGGYTIFHEYQSSVAGQRYSTEPDTSSNLDYSLTAEATGETVPLSQATIESTYSFRRRAGTSVFTFTIDTPGTYILSAEYPASAAGSETVLSIGSGYIRQFFMTLIGALAIQYVTVLSSIVILVSTFVRRRIALKRRA